MNDYADMIVADLPEMMKTYGGPVTSDNIAEWFGVRRLGWEPIAVAIRQLVRDGKIIKVHGPKGHALYGPVEMEVEECLGATAKRVLDAMVEGENVTRLSLADTTGLDHMVVTYHLANLRAKGLVRKMDRGVWRRVGSRMPTPATKSTGRGSACPTETGSPRTSL